MDRGAWQATVHGVTGVGHDLVTKPPPPPKNVKMTSVIGKAKQAKAGMIIVEAGWWGGYMEAYYTFLTPIVHV